MGADTEVVVTDNPAASRFEARLDGTLAGFAEYELSDEPPHGVIAFTHTEVGAEFGGRGVAGALARQALDTVATTERRVRPLCPFIRGWIEKHPDYEYLVTRHG